jgi:hypothetical protein
VPASSETTCAGSSAATAGGAVPLWTLLPADTSGAVPKVEGLAVLTASADMLELLAVVDADEPSLASPVLHLTVSGFA